MTSEEIIIWTEYWSKRIYTKDRSEMLRILYMKLFKKQLEKSK